MWEEIKGRFNILDSQKKTFTLIKKVIKFNIPCDIIDSKVFLDIIKWVDGVLLKDTTSKGLYLCIKNDSPLIARVIQCWGEINPFSDRSFFFDFFWKGKVEPKKLFFKWFLFLKKLDVAQNSFFYWFIPSIL